MTFAHRGLGRVAIIGAGFVGSTTAYALLISGVASEIVLVDRDRKRVEGHVNDLRDAALFSRPSRIVAGDLSECNDADVVVITAGVQQAGLKEGSRSRLDDLKHSASILREIIAELSRNEISGTIVIASNPVDVLTYAAWKWSGLPASRVIGSGTSLDTSRFRRRLGEHFKVAVENVHAYIIGEHGDSQVPVISSARIAGVPLEQFCVTQQFPYDSLSLKAIAEETRTAGLDIVAAKGATYYGIGAVLARIVNAILRDEHAVLTVSSLAPPWMNLGEVCLSLPAIVGREGVAHVVAIPLREDERQALNTSAEIIKGYNATLDLQPVTTV